jgi:hypothetical protein
MHSIDNTLSLLESFRNEISKKKKFLHFVFRQFGPTLKREGKEKKKKKQEDMQL